MEFLFFIFLTILILILILLYKLIHVSDIQPVKDIDEFILNGLEKDRELLLEKYEDLKIKINEVDQEHFDLVYREFKSVEDELEVNRCRIDSEMHKDEQNS